ncbi:MAG TPA: PKD domain-containing protein, partial [Thermoplasmata archaeon]|nr:PKD domain-containing protein [Thermoplasmata archaeon]
MFAKRFVGPSSPSPVEPTDPAGPGRRRSGARRRWSRSVWIAGVPVVLVLVALGTGATPLAHGSAPLPDRSAPFLPTVSATDPPRASGPDPQAVVGPAVPTLAPHPSDGAPTWWDVTARSTTVLTPFWFTEGAWDAADGYAMVYGGDDSSGLLNQTWGYSAGNWTEITTVGNPGVLDGPAMAFDPAIGSVVMYGGLSSYSPVKGPNATFFYSGGSWTMATISPSPGPRAAPMMTYDPDLGGVVLFGGALTSTGYPVQDDLWLFQNNAWSHVTASNPPPARWMSEIAFDPNLHELVLYGGCTGSYAALNDTWTFSGSSWTHVATPHSSIPALCGAMLDYDPDLGHVVLAGGINGAGGLDNATWEFNGTSWVILPTTGAPGGHVMAVGVWDPLDHEFVLAGGNVSTSGAVQPSHTNVLSIPLTVASVTAPTAATVGQTVTFTAVAVGGTTPHGYVWDWGDSSPGNISARSTHVYDLVGNYTVHLVVSGPSNHTANWSGVIEVRATLAPRITLAYPGVEVGMKEGFGASGSGGFPPYHFGWSFGDGSTASGVSVNHAYAATGAFHVSLSLTDSMGGTSSTSVTVTINTVPTVTIGPVPPADVGIAFQLTGYGTGGTEPYTYLWTSDDGSTASTGTASFTLQSAGNHPMVLRVTDAAGADANATA